MQQQMGFGLEPYVVSDFNALGLYATTGVVSQITAGVGRLAVAKILDIWGRPQAFAVMLLFVTIGLIMMAATNSVEMYMGAQVSICICFSFTHHLRLTLLCAGLLLVWHSRPRSMHQRLPRRHNFPQEPRLHVRSRDLAIPSHDMDRRTSRPSFLERSRLQMGLRHIRDH